MNGRSPALTALLGAALLLTGCNSMLAQNPSSAMKPVNAVRHDDEPRLMLGGQDVVAYFSDARSVKGVPQFRSEYEDVAFYFASAENKAMFDAAPQRYLPAYHGYSAMDMVYAVPQRADPAVWLSADGRVFLFSDAAARSAFELRLQANIAQADRYWREQVSGNGADWQRIQRLFEPVPGYKSADELAREVAAAKGG